MVDQDFWCVNPVAAAPGSDLSCFEDRQECLSYTLVISCSFDFVRSSILLI